VFATLAAGGRWSAARALPEVGDGTARPLLMPDGEEGFYAVEPPGFRVPNITVFTVTGQNVLDPLQQLETRSRASDVGVVGAGDRRTTAVAWLTLGPDRLVDVQVALATA
jgi:hypothetical protein